MPCLWRGTGFWATQASQVSSSIQSSLHGSIWECREWFKHQTESLNLTLTLQNMKQDEIKASLNQLWNYLTCAPTPTQGSTIGFVSNWISPHDMRSQRLCLAVSLEICCETLAVLGSGTKIPNVEFIETREMPQKEISSSVPPWNKQSFKQLWSNITQVCGDCKKPESNNKRKKTMTNLRSTTVFHHITLIRESNHAVVQWPRHMKQI